jgi:predicted transcriptional regulator
MNILTNYWAKKLLANDLDTQTYNITPKGSKFLEWYAELEKVE